MTATSATSGVRLGVVATNQERKAWALMAEVARKLMDVRRGEVRFWWHIDTLKRAWDIDALIADFGLADVVEVTLMPMDEPELVARYCQCDLTLAPGLGEGFAFPVWESLACGVPVVHGDYAGCASLLRTCGLGALLVHPVAWRFEGPYNARRPVYRASDWVDKVEEVLGMREDWRTRVAHLDWPNLGPRFQMWFDEGLARVQI